MIEDETLTTENQPVHATTGQITKERSEEEERAYHDQIQEDARNRPIPPRTPQERRRDALALTAAASIIGIGIAGLAHLNTPESRANYQREIDALKEKARISAITDATTAQYSSDALIGEPFKISEGSGLLEPALTELHETLGDAVFNDVQPLIYDTLKTSATIQAQISQPRPGETFAIVSKDINPESQDGNEYFVIDPSTQVVYTDVDTLDTPETH